MTTGRINQVFASFESKFSHHHTSNCDNEIAKQSIDTRLVFHHIHETQSSSIKNGHIDDNFIFRNTPSYSPRNMDNNPVHYKKTCCQKSLDNITLILQIYSQENQPVFCLVVRFRAYPIV